VTQETGDALFDPAEDLPGIEAIEDVVANVRDETAQGRPGQVVER
jgi:hypothetical protein